MSKLLKRALRLAVTPASLMIVGKLLAIGALVTLYNLDFTVTNSSSSLFSIQLLFTNERDTLFVNSVSNLVSLALIALPTYYMLARRTLLKDVQSNPRTVVKLTKINILKWVTKQETTFMQILIWTVFLWVISGITISSSVLLQTYSWIAIAAGVLSVVSAWGLLRTFEIETDRIYPKDNSRYL
jgi:hypothetical protein